MPRLLLLIPALAACSTQATTDGSTDLVEQSELDALAAQIVALQTRLDAEQAHGDELEQRLDDAETRLDDVEANTGTGTGVEELDARLSLVETDLTDLETAFDALTGRVDEIEDAMGNHIWSLSTDSDGSGGKGTDFSALGAGLDIGVTTTEPILAWCIAHSYEDTPSLRLTLTSADGSWTTSSNSYEVDENPYWKMYLTVMGSFTVPEAGDYTLDCEGKRGTTWYDYDLLAMQGT
ncbi:hypothetical protein L6R49_17875 [Myxococcota bacterium]|nr:hypothetical protein [Myxococcota bacterium]